MAVLIVCDPVDVHAHAVAWALEAYDTEAILWYPAPPWTSPGSVRLDASSVDYRFAAKGGDIMPASVDAVWMRRWPKPVFPPGVDQNDQPAARNELLSYHMGLLELLPQDILWANSLTSRRGATFKLKQLAAAVSVGLPIPGTIVTDDAAQARDFVASRPEGQTIYKPFHPFHWQRADRQIYQSVTTPVTVADFDDPQSLVWSPGIFQTFVPKAHELRVSVFGRTCLSARIFDQDPIDWRTRQSDMKVAPYDLPGDVERKLLALMDRLGLAMGMADLIVTPEGEHVFLEVNEQGQFLWVEEMCPDLPLLDLSARFFASGDPRFFKPAIVPGARISYAGFLDANLDTFRQQEKDFIAAGGVIGTLAIRDHVEEQVSDGGRSTV